MDNTILVMDIEEAKRIYNHPKGHSKEELRKCLDVLYEDSQPTLVTHLQALAIQDAIKRLGQLNKNVKE